MELSDLRRDFGKNSLDEQEMPTRPVVQLKAWLVEAKNSSLSEFNAMVLSTAGADGKPSSRIVLLKEITERGGLVFYSNYRSKKGEDLQENPFAACHFFWPPLERQIRIEGKVVKMNTAKSDAYFYSRPVESRVSAIVSPQSEKIESLAELGEKADKLLKNPDAIKRPEHWGAYELLPELFEFWQGGKHRLHDRIRYRQEKGDWKKERLAP